MQQALYRKYRPGKFADLVGQEPIKLTLANQVRLDKVGHAYIFAGPKGTGKTTTARILAKAVNCLDPKEGDPCGNCPMCVAADAGNMLDLIEIDAASNTGVDNIRELISKIYIAPTMAKFKVYVIDEAHMLSKGAFNALLKTLEEPPAHAIFILASTEIEKFPPTIVSRCQRFDFRPVSLNDVKEYLGKIAAQEKIAITEDGLQLIAHQSGGGMRDALSLLERAAALGEEVDADKLSEWFGFVDWTKLAELTEKVIAGDRKGSLALIDEVYRRGFDLTRMALAWTGVVRQMLVIKLGNEDMLELVGDAKVRLAESANKLTLDQLVWWLEEMLGLSYRVKTAMLPQLPLELTAVKVIEYLVTGGNDEPPVNGDNKEGVVVEEKTEEPVVAAAPVLSVAAIEWGKFVEAMQRQSPTLGAVMAQSKWSQDGGLLAIELSSDFYRSKLEQPASRQMVDRALAECGVELKVEYRLDEEKRKENAELDPALVTELFG